MASDVNISVQIAITDGPNQSVSSTVKVTEYEKVSAEITAGASVLVSLSVQDQPQLLMMAADNYDGLSYTVNESTEKRILDGPLTLVGAGNVKLLADNVKKLVFKKKADSQPKNTLTVLVGHLDPTKERTPQDEEDA